MLALAHNPTPSPCRHISSPVLPYDDSSNYAPNSFSIGAVRLTHANAGLSAVAWMPILHSLIPHSPILHSPILHSLIPHSPILHSPIPDS